VYAPGLATVEQIRAVVDAVGVPVNVLHWPNGPSVPEIGAAGARRVSTGGALASTAYGALMVGAHELRTTGTGGYRTISLQRADRVARS
jgi:2-methylisocitrate lyase-like PEP mutase family enzyme